MNRMYTTPKTELLSMYFEYILNMALRVWRGKGLSVEMISSKIESLQSRLERASKKEFVKIMREYEKGGE